MRMARSAAGLAAALLLAGGAVAQRPSRMSFDVTSPDYPKFGFLKQSAASSERQCGGQDVSPALAWKGEPKDTESFAIVMYDVDGNNGQGEAKWVAYNIPKTVHSLATGAMKTPGAGMTIGLNDHGNAAYYGPCPPFGKFHYYHFSVYALDMPVGELPSGLNRAGLLKAIARRVRANQSAVLTYQRVPPPGWNPEDAVPPKYDPAKARAEPKPE